MRYAEAVKIGSVNAGRAELLRLGEVDTLQALLLAATGGTVDVPACEVQESLFKTVRVEVAVKLSAAASAGKDKIDSLLESRGTAAILDKRFIQVSLEPREVTLAAIKASGSEVSSRFVKGGFHGAG